MGAPYTIWFDFTVRDALDATRLFNAGTIRRLRLFFAAMIAVGVVIAVVLSPSWGFALVGGAVAVVVLTESNVLDRWMIAQRARGILGKRTTFTLSTTGLEATSPLWTGTIPWGALTEIRENDRTVVFVADRILSAYVPSSAFGSAAARAEILAFAREQIAAARSNAGVTG
jgi:hypothetical protein